MRICTKFYTPTLYADDTNLFIVPKDLNMIISRANDEMAKTGTLPSAHRKTVNKLGQKTRYTYQLGRRLLKFDSLSSK